MSPFGQAYMAGDYGCATRGVDIIPESEWPAMCKRQIELLVAAGIARAQAESYYSEKVKK